VLAAGATNREGTSREDQAGKASKRQGGERHVQAPPHRITPLPLRVSAEKQNEYQRQQDHDGRECGNLVCRQAAHSLVPSTKERRGRLPVTTLGLPWFSACSGLTAAPCPAALHVASHAAPGEPRAVSHAAACISNRGDMPDD